MNQNIIIEGVKISSPDKIIFEEPSTTKEDVIRYYAKVGDRMLPYVQDRLLSIVRCPKGVTETCFFKKHPTHVGKGIGVKEIKNSEGEMEEYFYIDSTAGIISEAQMSTLEFHVWGSKIKTLEKPDMMVFDLDPDEGMDLKMVRQGVLDLKAILDQLNLVSYLKTSGGKGYHVVVPFEPTASWDRFNSFARQVVEVMEKKWPNRYTSNVRKASRADKIFIDWIRNGRGATSVAPYSLRARKGAKVSMPIAWSELNRVAPNGISMAQALKRLSKPDPWASFFDHEQVLK